MLKNFKLASWCLLLFITILVIFKILAQPCRISGDCMEPAIKDGELHFLNKISPYFRQYQIGDIVAFKHENKDWFARIIALENDTIKINEQNIIVNNITLRDAVSRNWTDWKYGTYAVDETMQVPVGHVYVLSDNLSAHHDDVWGQLGDPSLVEQRFLELVPQAYQLQSKSIYLQMLSQLA